MKRYSHLFAGASWIDEYGDPDKPADWAFLSKYSPYQNVRRGVRYPPVFFYLSTKDDRVHPGHARKMAAQAQGISAIGSITTNISRAGIRSAPIAPKTRCARRLLWTFLTREIRPGATTRRRVRASAGLSCRARSEFAGAGFCLLFCPLLGVRRDFHHVTNLTAAETRVGILFRRYRRRAS